LPFSFARISFDTSGAQGDREYLRDIRQTERFVLAYRAEKGHLPGQSDLDSWADRVQFERARSKLLYIRPAPIHYCNDKDDSFETPPKDQFVLSIWRGEIFDCYSSPSGKTTLEASERYWLMNSMRVEGPFALGALLLGTTISYGAFRLWPRRRKPVADQAASNS
jgi:hypothetical protein